MDKISVIMSAYNAEKVIKRAILSIENNTYDNLEIVVVNDCSTDSTQHIVSELAKEYSNIILINHRKNKGAGESRRAGILHSTGDYVAFVDSDDEICKDYYLTLFSILEKYNADIVWSKPQGVHPGDVTATPRITTEEVHTGEDILKRDVENKVYLTGTLSRRECWKHVEYSKLRFIEDTPTMYRLLHYCNKGVMTDFNGYYYYQYPNSLCHTSDVLKDCVYRNLSMIEMLEFDKEHKGSYNKKVFISVFKELADILKRVSVKETLKYKKELFKIYNYFTLKII